MARQSKPRNEKPRGGAIPTRREFSAGGLVWRRGARGGIEVAMIRPEGSSAWALPKGHVEQGESMQEAAVREVGEETGLKVGVVEKLGDVSYVFSWRDEPGGPLTRIFKRVRFFLMQFAGGDSGRHDHEIEEVAWLDIDEAIRRATYKNERTLIETGRQILRARGVGE